jgi:hypothetical protein
LAGDALMMRSRTSSRSATVDSSGVIMALSQKTLTQARGPATGHPGPAPRPAASRGGLGDPVSEIAPRRKPDVAPPCKSDSGEGAAEEAAGRTFRRRGSRDAGEGERRAGCMSAGISRVELTWRRATSCDDRRSGPTSTRAAERAQGGRHRSTGSSMDCSRCRTLLSALRRASSSSCRSSRLKETSGIWV